MWVTHIIGACSLRWVSSSTCVCPSNSVWLPDCFFFFFLKISGVIESRFWRKSEEREHFISASDRIRRTDGGTGGVGSSSFHVLDPAERGTVGEVSVCVRCSQRGAEVWGDTKSQQPFDGLWCAWVSVSSSVHTLLASPVVGLWGWQYIGLLALLFNLEWSHILKCTVHRKSPGEYWKQTRRHCCCGVSV